MLLVYATFQVISIRFHILVALNFSALIFRAKSNTVTNFSATCLLFSLFPALVKWPFIQPWAVSIDPWNEVPTWLVEVSSELSPFLGIYLAPGTLGLASTVTIQEVLSHLYTLPLTLGLPPYLLSHTLAPSIMPGMFLWRSGKECPLIVL